MVGPKDRLRVEHRQQRLMLGVGPVLAARNRVGHLLVQRLLAPRFALAGAVGLEPLRQQFVAVCGHIFKSRPVIILDETDLVGVTKEANAAMKDRISGTYKTTHWNEQEYSQLDMEEGQPGRCVHTLL